MGQLNQDGSFWIGGDLSALSKPFRILTISSVTSDAVKGKQWVKSRRLRAAKTRDENVPLGTGTIPAEYFFSRRFPSSDKATKFYVYKAKTTFGGTE